MDPVTTQATAKAVEATAKTAGKFLEIVHDVGGYLDRVFGDLLPAAVGLAGGNWLIYHEKLNVDAWRRRAEQIIRERDVKELIELSPNQAKELLLGAQDESRPELAELWARLLANAMDPNLNDVRQSFIEVVKKMDPPDALMLKELCRRKVYSVTREEQRDGCVPIWELSIKCYCSSDSVEASLLHLTEIKVVDRVTSDDWHLNASGRELMRACYPEITIPRPTPPARR